MLVWAAIFAGIALIAGMFAFGDISSVSSPVAMVVFAVFLIASGIAMIGHLLERRDVEKIDVVHDAAALMALKAVVKRAVTRISARLRR